jgi:hypothetical protein
VQRVVETDRRDRRTGDRRQQRATQRVAERVPEAGLERADREALLIVRGLAEGFDGGALHDEHVAAGPFFLVRVREGGDGSGRGLRVDGYLE